MVTGPTVAPDTGSNGNSRYRIPPAGTAVSIPVEGELIAEAFHGAGGQIRVYADGRVLSAKLDSQNVVERRLSPEGVELVRQIVGERVHLGYRPSAVRLESLLGAIPRFYTAPQTAWWEDLDAKPYVPARYGACFWRVDLPLNVEANQLPASAQALLLGSDPIAGNPRCLEVTPEEARSLEEILSETPLYRGYPWQEQVGAWSLRGGNGDQAFVIHPLFPEGRVFFNVPW
jgi:hypothetical protein